MNFPGALRNSEILTTVGMPCRKCGEDLSFYRVERKFASALELACCPVKIAVEGDGGEGGCSVWRVYVLPTRWHPCTVDEDHSLVVKTLWVLRWQQSIGRFCCRGTR